MTTDTTPTLAGAAKQIRDGAEKYGWVIEKATDKILVITNPEIGPQDHGVGEIVVTLTQGAKALLADRITMRTGVKIAAGDPARYPAKIKDALNQLEYHSPIKLRAQRARQESQAEAAERLKAEYKAQEDTPLRAKVRRAIAELNDEVGTLAASFDNYSSRGLAHGIRWSVGELILSAALREVLDSYHVGTEGLVSVPYGSDEPVLMTLEEHTAQTVHEMAIAVLEKTAEGGPNGGGSQGHRLYEQAKIQAMARVVRRLHPLFSTRILRSEWENTKIEFPSDL